MLTPRRSGRGAADMSSSAAGALDRIDHRCRAQCRDDVGEVFHVLHLDVDEYLEEVGRAVGDLEIGDVAGLLADDGGEAAEAARLVAERHVDAPNMPRLALAAAIPGDVEPALRRLGKIGERITIDGVNRDALAGGDDADDAVARQRMAA